MPAPGRSEGAGSAPAPWFVILIGVMLGRWLGYTRQLFVVIAALCLVVGLLRRP